MGRSKFVILVLLFLSFVIIGCSSQVDAGSEVAADVSTAEPPRATSTNTAVPTPIPTQTPNPTIVPTVEPTPVDDETAPYVVTHFPNEVGIRAHKAEMEIVFSEPMAFGTLIDAVQVEPEIDFSLRLDGNILLITLEESFLFDTMYNFTIDEQAKTANGQSLQKPYDWRHQLSPLIADIEYPTVDDLQQPIRITFNYPIDPASDPIQLEPEVAGISEWSVGNTILSFTPNEPLWPTTRYRVHFNGEWSIEGYESELISQPESTSFKILNAAPRPFPQKDDHVHPSTIVSIDFPMAMDEEKTGEAFKIEPAVPGVLEWHDNLLELHPITDRLLPNTIYTVTLLDTAVNANGQAIFKEPYTWSFETTDMYDLTSFGYGDNVQVLTVNGRRSIQYDYYSDEVDTVAFDLYQLNVQTWLAGDISGGEKVSTWEATDLPTTDYRPIKETILPDVPTGIYRLDLRTGNYVEDQLLLLVSAHLLAATQDETAVSTWVTDEDGRSVADAVVRVYDGDIEIGNGKTSASGFVQIVTKPSANTKVVAEIGNETAVIELNGEWQSRRPAAGAGQILLHTSSDRPVYYAGETLYFRTILRQDGDALAEMVSVGTAVSAKIIHRTPNYDWETIAEQTVASGHFGTANGMFTAPNEPGEYLLKTVVGETTHSLIFDVAPPTNDPFHVEISTDRPIYAQNDTVAVEVVVRNLDGTPLPNAQVELLQYESGNASCWGTTGEGDKWWNSYRGELKRTTDENGRIQLELPAEMGYFVHRVPNSDNAEHALWALHAKVTHNGRSAEAFTVFETSSTAQYVGLTLLSRIQAPKQPFTVQGFLQGLDGVPINGRHVQLELKAYNPANDEYNTRVETLTLTSDDNGNVSAPLTITQAGKYRIKLSAEDAFGNRVSQSEIITVYDEQSSANMPANFAIFPDKTSYHMGETARILIESPVDGNVWLTVGRAGIEHQEMVAVHAPMTLVEVPIEATYAPNVFVSAQMWQSADDFFLAEYEMSSWSDRHLRTESVNLTVIDPNHELQLSFTADKEAYAPGETAVFTVHVLNQQGEPVSAEVAFSMVDAAIFDHHSPHAPNLAQQFYFKRGNRIPLFNSMAATRSLGEFYGGCGCGGGAELIEDLFSHFNSTSLWNPSLITDHNGEATFTITMPQAVGDWRITLQAVSADTQLGDRVVTVSTK